MGGQTYFIKARKFYPNYVIQKREITGLRPHFNNLHQGSVNLYKIVFQNHVVGLKQVLNRFSIRMTFLSPRGHWVMSVDTFGCYSLAKRLCAAGI